MRRLALRACVTEEVSHSAWLHTTATQPSISAVSSQPVHNWSSNRPRGRSGAASRAPSSDSIWKEVNRGGMVAPCHRLAAAAATTSPVTFSAPGVGLTSIFNRWPLARQYRDTASSVGSGSPAKERECQPPASSRLRSDQGRLPATALRGPFSKALVVRSSVASCSRKGTPSALSLTSHSNMRKPCDAPRRKAASVFSGASLPAPRWAIQRG